MTSQEIVCACVEEDVCLMCIDKIIDDYYNNLINGSFENQESLQEVIKIKETTMNCITNLDVKEQLKCEIKWLKSWIPKKGNKKT